jgi:hypothetical protein
VIQQPRLALPLAPLTLSLSFLLLCQLAQAWITLNNLRCLIQQFPMRFEISLRLLPDDHH